MDAYLLSFLLIVGGVVLIFAHGYFQKKKEEDALSVQLEILEELKKNRHNK